MKAHKFPLIISFIAMIVFLISAVVCYFKINKQIDGIKINNPGITILTFDRPKVGMDIDGLDMMKISNEPIASSEAILNAYYKNDINVPFKFDIVMNNFSSYTKTPGVDGINSLEYTYEILKDGHIIMEEREIESYTKGSQTILLSDILESSDHNVVYTIIFRFYTNEYNQEHLIGTKLTSDLSVVPQS